MGQAIGDPEELERFAQSLLQFTETMDQAVNGLSGSFAVLGDTWQDEKRAKFEEDFNLLVKQMGQFRSNTSEMIPYLGLLANRLRDYLQS